MIMEYYFFVNTNSLKFIFKFHKDKIYEIIIRKLVVRGEVVLDLYPLIPREKYSFVLGVLVVRMKL